MTDEPDNWRSVGQVLAGMLRRGELGPPAARPAPLPVPSIAAQYCALSDDLCAFEIAWLASRPRVGLLTLHEISLGIHEAIGNRRAVIEVYLEAEAIHS